MKKKLSLLLVMVMALTMVLGTGVCAWADAITSLTITITPPTPGMTPAEFIDNNIAVSPGSLQGPGPNYSYATAMNYFEGSPAALEAGQTYVLHFSTYPGDGTYPVDAGGRLDIPVYINGIDYRNSEIYYNFETRLDITLTFTVGGSGGSGGAGGAGKLSDSAPAHVHSKSSDSAPAHVHTFKYGVITEPTKDTDGLEGEMCACGAVRNTQPISAYSYTLEKYALEKINASKPGQTITFEFGELNSFPKSFMEKLVEKSSAGVTFVFKYMVNHELQTITIPAGTPINLDFDWYGYAKMAELYGEN